MAILPTSIFIALTFWSFTAFSDSTGTPTFTQALESYKAADFEKSRQLFNELLTQHPNDPVLLYNLGLVEMNDKHAGKAAGYWRKALYLEPGFSPALSGMAQWRKASPNSGDNSLLDALFWRIPLWFSLAAGFLFFVVSGILWILHASRRKREISSSPTAPILTTILLAIFLGLSGFSYFSYYNVLMGTVLEPSLAVRSSPSSDSPSLVEFNEGDNVEVIRAQDDWLQVQKSATALGWVPKDKILIHSGF